MLHIISGCEDTRPYRYLCSDNIERTVRELGVVTGTSSNVIRARLKKNGMYHPFLLTGPVARGFNLDGSHRVGINTRIDIGNKEWYALSVNPRTESLSHLEPNGTYEDKLFKVTSIGTGGAENYI